MSEMSSNETIVQEKPFRLSIPEQTAADTCLGLNKIKNEEVSINLKIFTNQIPFYPFDQCIISRRDMKFNKEACISCSSVVYLHLDNARVKIMEQAKVTEEVESSILEKGYKRMVLLELYFDHQGIPYFDIKPPGHVTSIEERDLMKSTYVSIGQDSLERFKLKSTDMIKFGREIYKFTLVQDIFSPNFDWLADRQEHDMAVQGACRICLSNEFTDKDQIIAPCFCKGSCGLVHVQCLKKWLEYRMVLNQNQRVTSYNLSTLQCEVCKTMLPKYITINSSLHSLFPFPKELQKNILLMEKQFQKDQIVFLAPFKETAETQICLGRFQSNDITLYDNSISRRHATIDILDGSIYLRDNQSKYGTFVELQEEIRGLKEITLVKDRYVFQLKLSVK